MTEPRALHILLQDDLVGTITWLDGDRSVFSFATAYLERADPPTLSLSLRDRFGALITEHRVFQSQLMPWFSNLLPEGHLRDYLAARAGVKPVREFFLLEALGEDLPGAVRAIPAGFGQDNLPDSPEAASHRDELAPLRFSLAGIQLKFSAAMDAHGGLTIPAQGVGGSWIVKLPSARFPGVPENEFSMLNLARAAGITAPECALVPIDQINNLPQGIEAIGPTALAIRRFDRAEDGTRIHTEDFAQVFGVYPHEKYSRATARNLATVIANECGQSDVAQFVRRLTFNTLIGNADMHLKNWSLLYPDRRHARLAPAYDFVSTIAYLPDIKAALKVSRSARFADFDADELQHLAEKTQLPAALVIDSARETCERFLDIWAREKHQLPMNPAVTAAIDQHLTTIPILQR